MTNQPEPSGPSLAESMPAMAAEFAEACKSKGIALDYLPRTLPLVDRLIKTDPASVSPKAITAYVGEVIIRETGAFWYDFDDKPFLNVGDYQADPMTAVVALFERGTAQEGDLAIQSTKAYCELICRMQRLWLDGTILAGYESMSALRTSMTPDAKLAGWLVAQAQLAVKTAKMQFQESLDFSDDSLGGVERILSVLHKQATSPPGEGLTEEQLAEASKMWGAYVGEVVRRHYGGQWSTSADGVLQIALSGTSPAPVVKVRKRIVDGAADNVKFYVASIAKALSS